MPLIKYFGSRSADYGRPLWEIVLNLKNFGAGRYVVRTQTLRQFPKEPSFFKILTVRPHIIEYPDTQKQGLADGTFQGNILVESVFRGVKREEPLDIGEDAKLEGFRLILKEEEPEFLKKYEEYLANPQPMTVLPKFANLPPLWKEIIGREKGILPEEVDPILMQHDPIIPGEGSPRRIALDGETPTYKIGPGGFSPLHPKLYQHVIKSQEQAREKYLGKVPEPDYIYKDRRLKNTQITLPEDTNEGKHLGPFYPS